MKGLQIGDFPSAQDAGKRDAFHVPAVCAICVAALAPGRWVKFVAGSHMFVHPSSPEEGHGIADPFMDATAVKPTQAFWMLLKPGLTSNLTHNFSIEGVPDVGQAEEEEDDDGGVCRGCW